MATSLLTHSAAKTLTSGKASPRGIRVGPGRFVNLSGAPISTEQQIRQSIDSAMRAAKFTYNCLRCEDLLLEALKDSWRYRLEPHSSYQGKKVTRLSFGTKRSNDRDQEAIRMYLLSRFWYCWMLGTKTKPIVNNRHNPDTAFVQFVKAITPWFGMGNVVKNLERFEAYRKCNLP